MWFGNPKKLLFTESDDVNKQTLSVECTSVSECEMDISASHILNRLEIFDKSSGCHANPGIASIWNDERCRRSKMEVDVSVHNINLIDYLDAEKFWF